jgi:hypothetical protein
MSCYSIFSTPRVLGRNLIWENAMRWLERLLQGQHAEDGFDMMATHARDLVDKVFERNEYKPPLRVAAASVASCAAASAPSLR